METNPPRDVADLEERLSRPTERLIAMFRESGGDFVLLGAGGKMGPTLARMVRRAMDEAGCADRVIAVSRFSQPGLTAALHEHGIETVTADLLDETSWQRLPDAPRVLAMTGFKFGASDQPSMTWAMNAWLPALAARRYRDSVLGAFSSGNVYAPVPPSSGGSRETDAPAPVGEYGMSVLARERIYEYFATRNDTPTSILRLNYATELRYGVLVDIAHQVLRGQPVSVDMGHVNVVWQGDANVTALLAMQQAAVPAAVINIAGAEILSVAEVARLFGTLLDREVHLLGTPRETALLNNAALSHGTLHAPEVGASLMIQWIADWLRREMPTLDKPTHFEVTDGRF